MHVLPSLSKAVPSPEPRLLSPPPTTPTAYTQTAFLSTILLPAWLWVAPNSPVCLLGFGLQT